jgi:hypothetical protein
MDLVVVLPKVTIMHSSMPEEVGNMERTSWQQKLIAALVQAYVPFNQHNVILFISPTRP